MIMNNTANKNYYLICLLVFVLPIIALPQFTALPPSISSYESDYQAVLDSIRTAAANDWQGNIQRAEPKPASLRFLFDVMSGISTSKVEVICFRSSGSNANAGILSFWITHDAIYRIRYPVTFLDNYSLSLSKIPRMKTIELELDAFESVSLTKERFYTDTPPSGFYLRRKPSGTFECVYFHQIIISFENFVTPKETLTEDKTLNELLSDLVAQKVLAFNHLLKTLDELTRKPTVWSNDGTPRTRTE